MSGAWRPEYNPVAHFSPLVNSHKAKLKVLRSFPGPMVPSRPGPARSGPPRRFHADRATASTQAREVTEEQLPIRAGGLSLRKCHPVPEPYALLSNRVLARLSLPQAGLAVNSEALTAADMATLSARLGERDRDLVPVSRRALMAAIVSTYGAELASRAANGLKQRQPRMSAATGLTGWQAAAVAVLIGLSVGSGFFAPRETLAIYGVGFSFVFLLTILLRSAAASHASIRHIAGRQRRYRRLPGTELPRYTVLVAMFKEARVLPDLVAALRALDYPAAKLEVMLVLEEVDRETIAAARALPLPPNFDIVIVPDGAPRTKPRALNYALQFACGELLVIYDAEDRPDPNQLRKAAAHFRDASREVVCLQGKLTYDNSDENWLTRQFTIEYASLFDGILPMLDRAGLPLPLGGTSNHFRTAVLRWLGGWDPHNVTEDADLGMRIYRAGYRAEVLDSVTYEEAACHLGNWIRQRTRWLKGWMQTYCVHMREPRRLLGELGLPGFLAFQGHFAGIIVAALVHPWSYILIAHDLAHGVLLAGGANPLARPVLCLALFNLIAGYTASLILGWFTVRRFRGGALRPHLVFIPFYWLLVSAAAYRALYQFVTRPHYWEKTEHGVTTVVRGRGHRT
jgi:glycosyltransferase involved in cell wall biosynthesis